jgi:peptidyl-prolyl cis-trans isomerase D
MALIGKIRKNMWFVFIIIFLALVGFIVMDMVSASQKGGMATATTIGEVNGENIDYRDFSAVESALYGGTGDTYGSKEATWNYLVEKSIVSSEAAQNGFTVPTEELKTLLFGANPAPIVRQMFTDPNSGQFNRQELLNTKQAIESNQQLNPSFQNRWMQIERQVRAAQLQQKMGTAVSKGLYTPAWMVEQNNAANNTSVEMALVRIPFDEADDEIEVSEADVKNYIAGKENRYIKDVETRTIKYAVIEVIPTDEDSLLRRTELADLIPEFTSTGNDSLFALNNNGFYSPFYNKLEDLPESTRDFVPGMEVGEVYGPYRDQGYYLGLKLLGKQSVPDSIEARHILRSTNPANGGTSVVEARAFVDSLRNVLARGIEGFDSLAIKHSQDPGSGARGGDLGTFAQGAMVMPFNNAVFFGSKKGGLYTVTTQFGIHLIEVRDIIYNDTDNDYKVAIIRNPITPSDNTQEKLEGKMSEIVTSARSLSELEAAIGSETAISLETAGPFKANDYFINGLGSDQSSRDMIRWAFTESLKAGEVSPELYTFTDNVLYYDSKYVIAALESINKPGMPSMASLKNELELEVLKKKRGEILKEKINGTDLQAIASQFNVEIDTVSNITFSSSSLPSIGNEPEVIASAYGMQEGAVSQPIIGNNGVYIVKVISKTPKAGSTSVELTKNIMTNSIRSQAMIKLMDALRENAKIEDGRSRFF